jgi:hypothetical protein
MNANIWLIVVVVLVVLSVVMVDTSVKFPR